MLASHGASASAARALGDLGVALHLSGRGSLTCKVGLITLSRPLTSSWEKALQAMKLVSLITSSLCTVPRPQGSLRHPENTRSLSSTPHPTPTFFKVRFWEQGQGPLSGTQLKPLRRSHIGEGPGYC